MKTAKYKGRQYEVAWSGATKFGEKAKLKFMDDPNHEGFWAKVEDLTDLKDDGIEKPKARRPQPPEHARPPYPETCPHCGKSLIDDSGDEPF